jgi:hypothetical protein
MSSTADNQGELDGRSVTWFYQRTEQDQEGRLSWAEGRVTCKDVSLLSDGRSLGLGPQPQGLARASTRARSIRSGNSG